MTQAKKPRNNWKLVAQNQQARADAASREADRLKAELDKKAAEAKKRYSATVYCTNCLDVNAVSVPPGVRISEGDCLTCRVRGMLLLVREVHS